MEWGFVVAIIGVVIILLATIWYFASHQNQIVALLNAPAPINHAGTTTPIAYNGVNATGQTILLRDAVTLVTTSSLAVGGWVIGGIMVIAGTIWGLVARANRKPTSILNSLLPAALLQSATTPVVSSPAVVTTPSLTPAELAALRALVAASQ